MALKSGGIKKYIDKIQTIQNNAVRIISFAEFNAETDHLYNNHNILKIHDQITLQNCLFVHDYLNNRLPSSFNNTFCKTSQIHSNETRNATAGSLHKFCINSTKYGLNSIYRKSIESWNYFIKVNNKVNKEKKEKKEKKDSNIGELSRRKIKNLVTDHFMKIYEK